MTSDEYDRIKRLATAGDQCAANEMLRESLRKGFPTDAHMAVDIVTGFSRPFIVRIVCHRRGIGKDESERLNAYAQELKDVLGASAAVVYCSKDVTIDLVGIDRVAGEGVV